MFERLVGKRPAPMAEEDAALRRSILLSRVPALRGEVLVQIGGKKEFSGVFLELELGALVARKVNRNPLQEDEEEEFSRSGDVLREAKAAKCSVSELKNQRAGHEFAFRVDLAAKDSEGEAKYVLSLDTAEEKELWMTSLTAYSRLSEQDIEAVVSAAEEESVEPAEEADAEPTAAALQARELFSPEPEPEPEPEEPPPVEPQPEEGVFAVTQTFLRKRGAKVPRNVRLAITCAQPSARTRLDQRLRAFWAGRRGSRSRQCWRRKRRPLRTSPSPRSSRGRTSGARIGSGLRSRQGRWRAPAGRRLRISGRRRRMRSRSCCWRRRRWRGRSGSCASWTGASSRTPTRCSCELTELYFTRLRVALAGDAKGADATPSGSRPRDRMVAKAVQLLDGAPDKPLGTRPLERQCTPFDLQHPPHTGSLGGHESQPAHEPEERPPAQDEHKHAHADDPARGSPRQRW